MWRRVCSNEPGFHGDVRVCRPRAGEAGDVAPPRPGGRHAAGPAAGTRPRGAVEPGEGRRRGEGPPPLPAGERQRLRVPSRASRAVAGRRRRRRLRTETLERHPLAPPLVLREHPPVAPAPLPGPRAGGPRDPARRDRRRRLRRQGRREDGRGPHPRRDAGADPAGGDDVRVRGAAGAHRRGPPARGARRHRVRDRDRAAAERARRELRAEVREERRADRLAQAGAAREGLRPRASTLPGRVHVPQPGAPRRVEGRGRARPADERAAGRHHRGREGPRARGVRRGRGGAPRGAAGEQAADGGGGVDQRVPAQRGGGAGMSIHAEGKYRAAKERLSGAPDDLGALREFSVAARAFGKRPEALDALKAAYAKRPTPELYTELRMVCTFPEFQAIAKPPESGAAPAGPAASGAELLPRRPFPLLLDQVIFYPIQDGQSIFILICCSLMLGIGNIVWALAGPLGLAAAVILAGYP